MILYNSEARIKIITVYYSIHLCWLNNLKIVILLINVFGTDSVYTYDMSA